MPASTTTQHGLEQPCVPEELKALPIWVVSKAEARDGKVSKVPYSVRTHRRASINNPNEFVTFDEALAAFQRGDGIGVACGITSESGFIFVDFDNCVDLSTGEVKEWARSFVERLPGYKQWSLSGTGLHAIVRATKPGIRCKWPVGDGAVEIYDQHFCTFSSAASPGGTLPIMDAQGAIDAIYGELTGDESGDSQDGDAFPPRESDPLSDDALLERARNAANGEKFRRLYDEGDCSGYTSGSEADLALASLLAFWAGPNGHTQVERLMPTSALYRDKWDRAGYLKRTILRAFKGPREFASASSGGTGQNCVRKQPPTDAGRLVAFATAGELFFSERNEVMGRFQHKGHHEIYPVTSKPYGDHLRSRFYREFGKAVGDQAMKTALQTLSAICYEKGDTRPTYVRVAPLGADVYYDLGDSDWRVVRISPNGWEIVPESPVMFRRFNGTQAQVEPSRDGNLDLLRQHLALPLGDDGDDPLFRLVVAGLVASLIPDIEHPIFLFHGEYGSAKSTKAEMVGRLLDPNVAPLIAQPREIAEWVQTLYHRWFVVLDNVSRIPDWMSDAICRAITGDGHSRRRLYTDEDDVIFSIQRCLAITGINAGNQKSDLKDRCLDLGPLRKFGDNKSKLEIWREFERDRPQIVGGLFNAVSGVLRELPHIHIENAPRMADFARVGVALERVLGWPEGSFLSAYRANIRSADEDAIAASTFAQAVCRFMETFKGCKGAAKEWKGTASELDGFLRNRLRLDSHYSVAEYADWPKTPRVLSERLRELAPNLRAVGIDVYFTKSGGKRVIKLTWTGSQTPEEGSQTGSQQQASPQTLRPCVPLPVSVDSGDRVARVADFPPSSGREGKILVRRKRQHPH